jgi:beta-lactamase class A
MLFDTAARVRILSLAALLAACTTGSPPRAPRTPAPIPTPTRAAPVQLLEAALRERIARAPQGSVGLVAIDLASGLRIEINARESMHAASTMKVPVMMEVFRQATSGRFALEDSIAVVNSFRSIAADTAYSLAAADDSDSTLYARVGGKATVRELVRLMITRSSNLATNILMQHVAASDVMATMQRIGAPTMVVRRGVEDGPAYRAGLNNSTTADGFATSLEAIARCVVNRAEHCREMLDILAAQEFNEAIPAGLPRGTRVAHKTGWITAIQHDGAIIFPQGRPPIVLVVLTRGYTDRAVTAKLIADLATLVWDAWSSGPFAALPDVADTTRAVLALQLEHRADAIARRHFTHAHLWQTLEPWLAGTFAVEEVGRSLEDRPIRLLRYGNGPTRVLLWSQMHGDESTATMALADLIRFLHEQPADDRARRWREQLTLLVIPMLNPDGAERFVRHNAVGIDVNRDARVLATPEGRALKGVRDRFEPQFGFNLHDQNPRTRVGNGPALAAIALLAPPFDDAGSDNPVRIRSKHVASAIRSALEPLVSGHIARYDESFNPRAFGDLTTQWGTSTVLIESGGWRNDPQKQYLRSVNFVGLVKALDVIAAGSWADYAVADYQSLPSNGRSVNDLLIRGASIVLPGRAPVRADIAADFEDAGGRATIARITEVGDLGAAEARDTLDLEGLFLHPLPQPGEADPPGAVLPRMVASFVVRRTADPHGEVLWMIDEGRLRTQR